MQTAFELHKKRDENDWDHLRHTKMAESIETYIIVGGGHAAAQAVVSLRTNGFTGRIKLITRENQVPYHRPLLSKAFLTQTLTDDELAIRPFKFYEKNNTELLLDTEVIAIDRAKKLVQFSREQFLAYDKLLLATGANPRSLPGVATNHPAVLHLRSLSDARKLKDRLIAGAVVVIIGGGLIGLEVAAAAHRLGCQVTIIEAAQQVLERSVGRVTAEYMIQTHRERGVTLFFSALVKRLEVEGNKVRVIATNAPSLTADLVIVGTGVAPNVSLAKSADLPCDDGILVDQNAQTTDPAIFAVGDCANFIGPDGRRYRLESVQHAVQHAKVAAAVMCGKIQHYGAVPMFWSEQYEELVQIAGLPGTYEQVVLRGAPESGSFCALYVSERRITKVEAVNRPGEFIAAQRLIASRASISTTKLSDGNQPLEIGRVA